MNQEVNSAGRRCVGKRHAAVTRDLAFFFFFPFFLLTLGHKVEQTAEREQRFCVSSRVGDVSPAKATAAANGTQIGRLPRFWEGVFCPIKMLSPTCESLR